MSPSAPSRPTANCTGGNPERERTKTMSTLLDQSGLQMLFGSYAVGKAQCMSDPFVPLKAQEYRRNLAARMQPLDKAVMEQKLPSCDCFVSRKVDGECTLLLINGNQCCS